MVLERYLFKDGWGGISHKWMKATAKETGERSDPSRCGALSLP